MTSGTPSTPSAPFIASDPFALAPIPPGAGRVVVLTGASTGIGFATARRLAARGDYVFAGVRRPEHAARLLEATRGARGRAQPLRLDIVDPAQVRAAAALVEGALRDAGRPTLCALMNNAGVALGGPLLELDLAVLREQLEVNVTAQLCVIQAFAPLLGARVGAALGPRGPGRVIQVSSLSGVRAMPFVGPYTASKFALEGLCDSLRMELLPYGVDVIVVQPGPISTEIWDKAPTPEESPFAGSPYERALRRFHKVFVEGGKRGLPPERIAEVMEVALDARRPKARYVRTPSPLTRYWLPRLLPARRFDRLIGKLLGLQPMRFHAPEGARDER